MVTRALASANAGRGTHLQRLHRRTRHAIQRRTQAPRQPDRARPADRAGLLVAIWYAGLTALALAFAYRGRGLGRPPGAVIITGYLAFVSALAIAITQARVSPAAAAVPAAVITLAGTILLARPPEPARCPAAAGRAA